MSEPVVVFRAKSDIEAAVVQALLDSHGIDASFSSDVPHAVFPLAIDGLGEVRLTVCAEDAERGRRAHRQLSRRLVGKRRAARRAKNSTPSKR